jgi:hypothetical protein
MTSSLVATQTLETPELLELILSHLPEQTLLLVQGVCRTWRILISNSPTLQTALYFRSSVSAASFSKEHTLNPLITSAFPFLLTPHHALSDAEANDWDIKFGHLDPAPDPSPVLITTLKAFQYSSWTLNPEAWKRKEASWRKMLVSNPPVTHVVFEVGGSGMAGTHVAESVIEFGPPRGKGEGELGKRGWLKHGEKRVRVERECGLRMGLLYDHLYEKLCTGYEPTWEIEFGMEYPTERQRLSLIANEKSKTQLGWEPDDEGAGAEKDAQISSREVQSGHYPGDGLTLTIAMHWSHSCIVEEEVGYPQFESEAFESVKFGPRRVTKNNMWD